MWCIQVLRSPNFLSREWKQVEMWKLLEMAWLFFRLGDAKCQHCPTRWMFVTSSSDSSVLDTSMATFTFEEQRVIIRFLHLRDMEPIEIHQQLSETCNDGVMDVKNVGSWVRQFKVDRKLCKTNRRSFAHALASGHNEPLKKRLLRPCNHGVSVMKNVYVYRVITLRNDSIFSFLGWVIFFK